MQWIPHPLVRITGLGAACVLALALAAGAAAEGEEAQQTAAPPAATGADAGDASDDSTEGGIEEITVTARKREEKIQETPISITAFTERSLEERGIGNITELTQYTPNLKFDTTAQAGNTARIFIRGIGQEDGTINAEQGVGLYIDGVYQTRSLGSVMSLHDIQRIEVLRGPQGTLFGKNAIGGAISVITNQPGPEYGVRAMFEVGNLDAFKGFLMLNAPVDVLGLGDKLFVRGSVALERRDGYLYDRNLDMKLADHKFLGGRAAIRFLPRDDLEFSVTYWQANEDENSPRGECELIVTTQLDQDFLDAAGHPNGIAALGGDYVEECEASHQLVTSTNLPSLSVLDSRKVFGTILWDSPEIPLIGSLTVKSITAYQSLDQDLNLDLDVTALRVLESQVRDVKHRQFSEELQLLGQSFDARLEWVLGGFWLKEEVTGPSNETFAATPHLWPFNLDLGDDPWGIDISILDHTEIVQDTYAAYLYGTYQATERLSINGGVRYVYEKKRMDKERWFTLCGYVQSDCVIPFIPNYPEDDPTHYNIGDEYLIAENPKADVSDSWDAWTGVLGARYQVTDDFMVYGGYQRGFRSGGYNYIGDDASGEPNAFDPEYLDGIEFGLKSTWFDRKMVANLAYFFSYHHDMQLRVKEARSTGVAGQGVGSADVILNAGDATIQGGELELEYRPIDGLRIQGGLGLTFPKYKNFELLNQDKTEEASLAGRLELPDDDPQKDTLIVPVYDDLSDNDFQHTSKVNFNILVSYTLPVLGIGDLTAQANYYYRSKVYFHIRNFEELSQGPIGIYGARLSFSITDWNTELALWCKNLFDRRYIVGGIPLTGFASVSRFYAEPRTFGFTLTQRFGGG